MAKLSVESTRMFHDILEEMKARKYQSVDSLMLIWGILNTKEKDSVYSTLAKYLFSLEDYAVTPRVIENAISDLFGISQSAQKIADTIGKSADGKTLSDKDDSKKDATASSEVTSSETEQKDANDTSSGTTTNSDEQFKEIQGEISVEEVLNNSSDIKDNVSDATKAENITETPSVTTIITFTDYEGNELEIPFESDLDATIEELFKIVEKFGIEDIEPLHFVSAMFSTDNDDLIDFFCVVGCNYDDAKNHFHPDHILVYGSIPFQLSGFLSTLNDTIDGNAPCEILCRDKEVDSLWNIILKKNKRNAVIIGEPGVGKSALIEKLTHDINSGICPSEFKDFKVIVLDVNSLIAGTKYRGDAEERIKDLIKYLKDNDDVILFIDEVHTILGAGSCFEGEMDLANALKPILARGDTIVLGATTQEEYEKYFQKDGALTRRFEEVVVKEPLSDKVYPMIKNKIAILSDYHKVTISREMVTYAVMIASCFAFEKKNPDKTLDLIDKAMVYAKRHKKKRVDKNCIIRTFDIFFEMWDKMSEDSRKEIAYHEAGHYIVGKASGRLTRYIWQAVSIMPAEKYLGVTVYEEDDTIIPFCNINYYIDDLALHLGGRVAEKLFRKQYTSGASADLYNTTREANYIVSKLAMVSDDCPNRVYLNDHNNPNYSEKVIDTINDEVDKLVKKAEERATQILNENMDILEAIVEALLKQRIMSEKELDKVWKETVAKRKNP